MTTPSDVLDFWFAPANAEHWFVRDEGFDARIRERFGTTVEQASTGALASWQDTPRGWLACLIVLDQFSRNIFRNDPRAWAQDVAARDIALAGIARGNDRRLPPLWRVFAYLPLEHAEDTVLQQRSVQLFSALREAAPEDQAARFDGYLDYAQRHADVIARFGRFPHRNAILGRTSTAEEQAWLAQPGSGF